MSHNHSEWEDVKSRLSIRSESIPTEQGVSLGTVLLGLSILISSTAVILMLANMVVLSAWPSIEALSPAIGYRAAWLLSALFWIFRAISAITSDSKLSRGK